MRSPGVQPENPAQSEHFGDFIVKYMQNVENTMELFPGTTFQAVNEIFGILYVPLENTGELEITGTSYNSIPKCYTYMDMERPVHRESPDCMTILILS